MRTCCYTCLLLLAALYSEVSSAQNIVGDTIFVGTEGEVEVVFGAKVKGFETSPEKHFFELFPNSQSVSVRALKKYAEPIKFLVDEGNRRHEFVLAYKDGVSAFRLDLSDLSKVPINAVFARKVTKQDPVMTASVTTQNPPGDTNDFNSLIKKGDEAKQKKEYEEARRYFELALQSRPADKVVVRKIAEVDQMILAARFRQLMDLGDDAMTRGDAEEALQSYREAEVLKSKDVVLLGKIKKAEDLKRKNDAAELKKNALQEAEQEYQKAINVADRYFEMGELDRSIEAYNRAKRIFKDRPYPDDQIKMIKAQQTKTTAEGVSIETPVDPVELEYQHKMKFADSLLVLKQFKNAIFIYKKAQRLKPASRTPGNQITYASMQQAEIDKIEKQQLYNAELEKARKAIVDKDYVQAHYSLEIVVGINPNHAWATQQLKNTDRLINQRGLTKMESWKAPVKEIDSLSLLAALGIQENAAQPAKENSVIANSPKTDGAVKSQEEVKKDSPAKVVDPPQTTSQPEEIEPSGPIVFKQQTEPIPFKPNELAEKFPSIQFEKNPEAQQMNMAGNDEKNEFYNDIKRVLKDSGHISLKDENPVIMVTLTNISFYGSNAYLTIRLQNKSRKEFLTGAMMVKWKRRVGATTRMMPLHITSFPIVLPHHEITVVYATRNVNIAADETLYFELSDRNSKNEIMITIPGNIYNEAKNRKASF
jgi:tetratricopeptide (TPR) repeat protein